ncbi:MAG: hypothetical protein JXR46_16560 [Calditrichaceae bacterium]|nr:hypothetical protein [Calditrichaceae bacterium]RQV96678.1 MAG: hypothetical protein EH224_03760 [Calditrichota bacterium]
MKRRLLIYAAVWAFIFTILHFLFWPMLNWSTEVKKLSVENQGIMEALNLAVIYFLITSAVFTLVLSKRFTFSSVEKWLLRLFGGFYLVRMISGLLFFTIGMEEIVIWIVCLSIFAAYWYSAK